MSTLLDYYQDIIPDIAAFKRISQQPLPVCFWANSLKVTPQQLQQSLHQSGIQAKALSWNKAAFRCSPGQSLGLSWQYRIGLLQIQEEVSMLSGQILKPQPGERVLDMCAAPGNKTAQMAVSMQNKGMLVANDRQYQRLRAMGQIIKRLGLININMTVYDGRQFPLVDNYFDKVLVDAPCSCEGTFRKNLKKIVTPNAANNRRMASVQIALLKRALTLCRPGGTILYSTCTFAPEENEAVIDCLLRKHSAEVELLPIEVDGFEMTPGITQWQDQRYADEVQLTRRVWPYQNNTGGFYLALLRKRAVKGNTSNASRCTGVTDEQSHNSSELAPYFSLVQQRYNFPEKFFDHFAYSAINGKGFYIKNHDNKLPREIRSDMSGVLFIKTNSNFPKLSTPAAMLLGKMACQNTVSLSAEQMTLYMQREQCLLSQTQVENLSDTGFVVVLYQEFVLGSGLYLAAQGDQRPRLQSLFPKYL